MTDGWDDLPSDPDDQWDDEPTAPGGRPDPAHAVRRGASVAAILFVSLAVVSIGAGTVRFIFGAPASSPANSQVIGVSTPGSGASPRPSAAATPATLTLAPSNSTATPTFLEPAEGQPVTVVSIVDGDTIHIEANGVDDTVRIIGIDTPETRAPGVPIECFGPEATAAAKELLVVGDEITLELDPTQAVRDRYDRLLAHVFLPDGRLFAEEMIRFGFGTHYVYGGVPSIFADRLEAAEDNARTDRRGLWSACPAT